MTSPANAKATMEGQYAFVEGLVSTIPELAQLVKNASAQGATPDAFSAMLQATNWWKWHSDSAKKAVALQASNPAEYQQQINQATQHVKALAAQMGVPLTDAQVSAFATTDLYQGLNDDLLKASIGGSFTGGTAPGTATGDVADYQQQLQSLAASYGVPVTQTWINNYVQQALTTGQSPQEMAAGARAALIQSAQTAYPTLSQQLASGLTVHDIAQPYIATMSQVLEIPDTNIDVTDPSIQKALSNPALVPGGKSGSTGGQGTAGTQPGSASSGSMANQPGATTMPLWQFQQQLKQDPRWQQTDNAKSTAYSLAHQLGSTWGFAS